jgi:TPR repeat protein
MCLQKGEGVSRDLKGETHYFKLAADQGYVIAQFNYGICLQNGEGILKDVTTALKYFKLSTDNRNTSAQLILAHLFEEGIICPADHMQSAKYYELSTQLFPVGCACYGWCLQNGIGIPICLTEAAECFQRASNDGNADGANCLTICLERGQGMEQNTE